MGIREELAEVFKGCDQVTAMVMPEPLITIVNQAEASDRRLKTTHQHEIHEAVVALAKQIASLYRPPEPAQPAPDPGAGTGQGDAEPAVDA